MGRPFRPTVNLTEEEAAALQAHPDWTGSLAGTLRLLALRQMGIEPDPYADHKSRARDEKGRIMKTAIRTNKNGDEHIGDLRRAVAEAGFEIRHVQGRVVATSGPAIFKDGVQLGAAIFGFPDNERVALERALDLVREQE